MFKACGSGNEKEGTRLQNYHILVPNSVSLRLLRKTKNTFMSQGDNEVNGVALNSN